MFSHCPLFVGNEPKLQENLFFHPKGSSKLRLTPIFWPKPLARGRQMVVTGNIHPSENLSSLIKLKTTKTNNQKNTNNKNKQPKEY
jgi:hypothetical protein